MCCTSFRTSAGFQARDAYVYICIQVHIYIYPFFGGRGRAFSLFIYLFVINFGGYGERYYVCLLCFHSCIIPSFFYLFISVNFFPLIVHFHYFLLLLSVFFGVSCDFLLYFVISSWIPSFNYTKTISQSL